MALERYFVFLYPDPGVVRDLLNLAIFILNPDEKWQAHVTLAGPYESSRKIPRNLSFNRKVSMIGAGQFRSEHQSTVYVTVGARDLRNFWDKPDFPYTPHLTIYDGKDTTLADALYRQLSDARMFLSFNVKEMQVVRVIRGQGSIDLLSNVRPSALPSLRHADVSDLKMLSRDQRIRFAVEALKRAKFESSRNPQSL